jgi:hypothetical protein
MDQNQRVKDSAIMGFAQPLNKNKNNKKYLGNYLLF